MKKNNLDYGKIYKEQLDNLKGIFFKTKGENIVKEEYKKLKKGYVFKADTYEEHLRYLKELFQYQESRQTTIENKLSHLIGQTGIIISFTALFITLFYREFLSLNMQYKLFLLIPFGIGVIMFLVSVFYSIKSLDISGDGYSTGSTKTVAKNHINTIEFAKEEINDLFTSITINTHLNSNKANKLINSQKYFRYGLICMGILILLLSILMLFANPADCNK